MNFYLMLKPHFLQSHQWQKYSELEGYTTFTLSGDNFQALALKYTTPVGSYLYCPYGPTLDPARPEASLRHALTALTSLAQSQGAFFIRIEPTYQFSTHQLQSLHLVKSHDLNPAHTWVIDLTADETTITSAINKNKFRDWRIHEKKNISYRTSQNPDDVTILTDLLKSVSAHNHFTPQSEAHLKNQLESGFATLYLAELTPSDSSTDSTAANAPTTNTTSTPGVAPASSHRIPIAAALVYDYAGTRFYAHAAADDAHRKLGAGASLLVQIILDAKHQGSHTFDFWGITTSTDPHHPWYGFTQFKKSFGGHQVDYSGTWDLPLHKFKYHLYGLLRRLNRALRRSA